jgi:RimJ/RimL family protein N-acetyltransferase
VERPFFFRDRLNETRDWKSGAVLQIINGCPELVPRIETDRLVLRGFEERDLDAHAAACADPEVMRYLGGALDRAQSWRQMATHLGHWTLRGYGNWAIERKFDGVLIGRIGLWNPEGWPGLEMGWKLVRGAWGNGYATEAGLTILNWTWNELTISQVISIIDPRNLASQQVAKRLGMQPSNEVTIDGVALTIFTLLRPTF